LKEDPSAPVYGHYLAHKSHQQTDVVRHFGLGLLEDSVRFRWTAYTAQEQLKIRHAVVDLVASGMHDILNEKRFIKEKVARIFAELVEREWPHNWIDLEKTLHEMFTTSVSSRLPELTFGHLPDKGDLEGNDTRTDLYDIPSRRRGYVHLYESRDLRAQG
jgi:exportin-5